MNEQDTGVYLTERLRRSQPEYFEQELARGKRNARLLGLLVGGLVAFALAALGTFSLIVFAPELAEALFFGLR